MTTLLSLGVSAVAVPVAAGICFAVAKLGKMLGYRSSRDRLSAADLRWLAPHSGPDSSR